MSLPTLPPIPPVHPPSELDIDTDAALQDPTRMLELRINLPSVLLYSHPPQVISNNTLAMTPNTPSPVLPSICLLRGRLSEFCEYSRQEASQWLLDIAHDICDPTDKRGSLVVWKNPQQEWFPVANTDPLTASIYRYSLPDGVTVGLSKISLRVHTTRKDGDASTMAAHVRQRDGKCWMTGVVDPLANSHICPKRLGDHVARFIFDTFTSLPRPPNLTIQHEIFGINLTLTMNEYFRKFDMGFRLVSPLGAPDKYECHLFRTDGAGHTVYGRFPLPLPAAHPLIHGHPVVPPHPQREHVPPPGLFRWHYLQCVIKRFAHTDLDYKSLPNINFSELTLRMEGDSDDESTDSEAEWP